MKPPSYRVYFVTHHDGRLTGHLIRSRAGLFDGPPQSAYGETEDEVYSRLTLQLRTAEITGDDHRSKYFWTEAFEVATTKVTVHPESAVGKRRVIGAREVPLRLSFAWSKLDNGGYRVVLPRFDWWFIVETLDIAAGVLRSAVSGSLIGEQAKWLYDFRREGDEYVKEWTPDWAAVKAPSNEHDPFESYPELKKVADELLREAQKKRLPIAIGNNDDFLPFRKQLLEARPAPLLIVGGAGVGKTTWIQRLARYLLLEKKKGEQVPSIFSTGRDRIVAGQIYLGMWQARCLSIVRELAHERQYLSVGHLSELATPMSDGASILDIFEEAMHAEEISLIAEASEADLARFRMTRPRLIDAFVVVRLHEPAVQDVPHLLQRYLERRQANDRIRPEGLVRLVRHLADFAPGQRFAGKAFRATAWLLDEAGTDGPSLDPSEVSRFFSRYSGLPHELIADEFSLPPEAIEDRLRRRVIGQPEACKAAGEVLARLKAGLHDPERPIGSLFFVGPTGVGKTELAKQIARFMFGSGADPASDRLVRVDMSEYMLPGSALRLLNAESEGAGSLAQRIRQQPLSVVLFDEIEKAHPEVFDLLLALLGEGRMTDSRGRLVDFRMVVFIMTSNLGVSDKQPVGFGGQERTGYLAHVRDHFRPEFFGRLDQIVSFRALSPDDVVEIAILHLRDLDDRVGLQQRNLRLRVTDAARRRIAERGFHPTRGARPLKRVIEEAVVTPLAVKMAEDPSLRDRDVWIIESGESAPGSTTLVI